MGDEKQEMYHKEIGKLWGLRKILGAANAVTEIAIKVITMV